MTRKECLEQAMGCVLRDRNNEYGEPENSFDLIADLWTAYTGHVFIGSDIAAMMALLKLARLKRNAQHLDSAVDLAGYAACFAECASAEVERPVPFAPKAKGNSFQNGNGSLEAIAEPEFKPGDRVQARLSDGVWRCAVVSDKEIVSGKLQYTVKIVDFSGYYVLATDDVRSAPRVEGCEDLVQKDAPQTQQELYNRIVANNPATFKARTPTGEELAEMAEEEGR